MEKLRGLIAAPFTPLDDQGALNLEQVKTLVQLYKKNGVNGAFICGSTGEGSALSHEEKKQLMEAWGEAKDNRLKTVYMLGGTCLKEMKELAALAQQNNMDGISILSPYYFKPASVKALVHFCREVAASAPDLPFYYYHIPALTRGDFAMLEFLQLADELIPNLAGIKFTAPDLFDFQACTRFKNGKYNLLWGIDEALLSGLVAGADGAVGSTYNYAAPLFNQILKAFENREFVAARELQLKAVEMVGLLLKYGGTGAGKAFMKLIGVDCGWFRPPVMSPDEEGVTALKSELETIGFFKYCSRF